MLLFSLFFFLHNTSVPITCDLRARGVSETTESSFFPGVRSLGMLQQYHKKKTCIVIRPDDMAQCSTQDSCCYAPGTVPWQIPGMSQHFLKRCSRRRSLMLREARHSWAPNKRVSWIYRDMYYPFWYADCSSAGTQRCKRATLIYAAEARTWPWLQRSRFSRAWRCVQLAF